MKPGCIHRVVTLVVSILLALGATVAKADIPASERTILLNLYASTNGGSWHISTNWNGAIGTECTWYGIICDAGQTTVTGINLPGNNLTGSFPSGVNGLTNLTSFKFGPLPFIGFNHVTGSIPALTGLTKLQEFDVYGNELTGSIPALTGLTNLQYFRIDRNHLTGSIPALTGLTSLKTFSTGDNQLTGSIPELTGLTNLFSFVVAGNRLIGNVPSVPSPSALSFGLSSLCPNFVNPAPDPAWDAATGITPWYTDCTVPCSTLDIDGNGTADALTDGLLMIRYLFGLRGVALIQGAVGAGAQRTSATEIEACIQSLLP